MADKIVAEYTVKVDQALKDLNKLAARVNKIDDERKKVQDGFKDMSKGMAADFKKVGAAIGLAFGVDQLVSFGKEAVKVAAQAEGIRTAFARLNQPNLLNELRKATRGAVDDITLMRQAIRAQNFKVPLEQLGTFFEFATKRSIQTGESVDYLVNSIIDGIGRKSTLVLDNLGISATELQEEMKRTGDFGAAAGAIIARELEKAGDVADTTAIKIEQMNVVLENAKVLIGEGLVDAADLYLEKITPFIDETGKASNSVLELAQNTGYLDAVLRVGGVVLDKATAKYQNIYKAVVLAAQGVNGFIGEAEKAAFRLTLSNDELVKFNDLGDEAQKIMVRRWMTQEEYNDVTDDAIKATELFNKKTEETNEPIQEVIKNLAYYNQLIKDLQAEQADANTTRERVRQLEDEINEAIRQRLLLLGKLREVGGETFEGIESIAKMELLQQQELTDDILADYEHRNGEIEAAIKKRNEIEARLAEERKQITT